MKKYLASTVFLLSFAAYVVYHNFFNTSASYTAPIATLATTQQVSSGGTTAQEATPTPIPTSTQTQPEETPPTLVTTNTPAPTPTPVATPTPAPAPVQTQQGQYNNGTYMGDAANAYYGNVQVQVTVSGGAITDVEFLQYPSDRSTSRYINSQAMPILKSEAIQSQSAQVDAVSGASDTSAAFEQSLASALSQAKS